MHLLFRVVFMALGCVAGVSALAQKPALAQLYPAAPPEGSSFVRFVNPSNEAAKVSLAGVEEKQALSAVGNIATSYKMVNPTRPLQVLVNGKSVLGAVKVEPNTFVTLVIKRNGEDYSLTALQDSTQGHNALKADLRVYNLVSGCSLAVTADKDLKVFDNLNEGETRRRAINPVAVDLAALCGKAVSASLSLPQLQPGSRYSLFVTGEAAKPVLTGKLDAVE
jgi:alginate O-acetyltransferase complex protein AlgF